MMSIVGIRWLRADRAMCGWLRLRRGGIRVNDFDVGDRMSLNCVGFDVVASRRKEDCDQLATHV